MLRKLDLDLDHVKAPLILRLIAEAADTPIVLVGPLDAEVNAKAKDETALALLDEVLAQAGAERRDAQLLTVTATGPIAATTRGEDVTLALDGAPLGEVVAALSAKLGEPIFVPGTLARTPVSAHFARISAGEALARLLRTADLGLTRAPGFEVESEQP